MSSDRGNGRSAHLDVARFARVAEVRESLLEASEDLGDITGLEVARLQVRSQSSPISGWRFGKRGDDEVNYEPWGPTTGQGWL